MNKSRGRPRRGTSDARERIQRAAAELFAERGYHGATLRQIAAAADVDVSLISYHFGSKRGVFAAVHALHSSPAVVLRRAMAADKHSFPERLVTLVVQTWDDPDHGAALRELVLSSASDPATHELLREYIGREVVDELAAYLGGPNAVNRAVGGISVVIGLIFGRYLAGIEPIASMSPERVVTAIAPALRAATGFPPARRARR